MKLAILGLLNNDETHGIMCWNWSRGRLNTERSQVTIQGLRVEIVQKDIKNLQPGRVPPGWPSSGGGAGAGQRRRRGAVIGKLGWIKRRRAGFGSAAPVRAGWLTGRATISWEDGIVSARFPKVRPKFCCGIRRRLDCASGPEMDAAQRACAERWLAGVKGDCSGRMATALGVRVTSALH